jgi:hypothetical protein
LLELVVNGNFIGAASFTRHQRSVTPRLRDVTEQLHIVQLAHGYVVSGGRSAVARLTARVLPPAVRPLARLKRIPFHTTTLDNVIS